MPSTLPLRQKVTDSGIQQSARFPIRRAPLLSSHQRTPISLPRYLLPSQPNILPESLDFLSITQAILPLIHRCPRGCDKSTPHGNNTHCSPQDVNRLYLTVAFSHMKEAFFVFQSITVTFDISDSAPALRGAWRPEPQLVNYARELQEGWSSFEISLSFCSLSLS